MSSRSLSQAAPCDRVAADKAADAPTGDAAFRLCSALFSAVLFEFARIGRSTSRDASPGFRAWVTKQV